MTGAAKGVLGSARWLWASGLLIALAALFAVACGDGGEAAINGQESGEEPLVAQIVSTDLALGPNVFSLGLLTADNEVVLGARVHLRFFQLRDGQGLLRGEGDAAPVKVTLSYTETHEGGVVHTHEAGQTGVYKTNVEFDQPGPWAVEVTATANGKTFAPMTVPFDVREVSRSPAIGDGAPLSRQTVLADVGGDVTKVDTSNPPNPEMHTMTIAAAVASGKPSVIVFATPAFCLSRVCGPTKQIVDKLYLQYKEQVNFIHVEPYELDKARSGEGLVPVPVVSEWGLESEPWVFVIDRQGKVAAKFEAVVAESEIEGAIQQVLAAGG